MKNCKTSIHSEGSLINVFNRKIYITSLVQKMQAVHVMWKCVINFVNNVLNEFDFPKVLLWGWAIVIQVYVLTAFCVLWWNTFDINANLTVHNISV